MAAGKDKGKKMMEDNRFDSLVRSTIEGGTEEVPAGLWDAIEGRLPSRKKILPLWLRIAAPVAAVAAAVALVVVFAGRDANPGSTSGIDIVAENDVPAVSDTCMSTVDDRLVVPDVLVAQACAEETSAAASSSAAFRPSSVPASGSAVYDSDTSDNAASIEEECAAAWAAAPVQEAAGLSEETVSTDEPHAEDGTIPAAVQDEVKPVSGEDPAVMSTTVAESTAVEESASVAKPAAFEEESAWSEGRDVRERRRSGFELTFSGSASSNSNPKLKPDNTMARLRAAASKLPTETCVRQTSEASFGVPLSVGLGFRYNFTPRWSIGSGFRFTFLSRTFDGNFYRVEKDAEGKVISEAPLSSESFKGIRNNQFYFGVPLDVYFNIVNNRILDFYVYAGGAMDKMMQDKYRMKSASGDYTLNQKATGLQWSVNAGLGLEFIVSDQVGIYLDPSCTYYINNTSSREIQGVSENILHLQQLMFGVNVGVRLRL